MWATSVIFSSFFLCRPFAFNWDQTIPGGSCGNQVLSYQITGVLNLLTDVVVLLLPMPYIWKLQLRLSRKIALTATFSVGVFVCALSILRIVSLSTLNYKDITYNIPQALIWGTLEPELGIILACVPICRPIFMRDRSVNGSGSGSGNTSNSSYSYSYRCKKHSRGIPSSTPTPNNSASSRSFGASRKEFELLGDEVLNPTGRGYGAATRRADLEAYPLNNMSTGSTSRPDLQAQIETLRTCSRRSSGENNDAKYWGLYPHVTERATLSLPPDAWLSPPER
ncbi:MAG: hypothetical protein Q9227_005480 [Pyrenula ochraceoflavens]